jgi:glycosyltransferase involved in cell wall biosynthesis
MTPRVDILLPVRNAAATLGEALGDLRAQSLRSFRCLVLDDGSTDGTRALADGFAAEDSRFEVHGRPACGIVATLNAGLEMCLAPYVARVDADDRCSPNRLERQVGFLDANPAADPRASRWASTTQSAG